MTSKFWILLLASIMAGSGVWGSAFAQERMHSIHVTLFGQPCLLEGPVEAAVLKNVHSISPEQAYPTFEPGENSSAVKSALEKLRSGKEVPNALDPYREQLGKRLEAQFAFLKGLEDAQHQKKADALLSQTKSYFQAGGFKTFEATARKLEGALNSAQRKEIVEKLFTSFEQALPADPQEEFHKAIRELKIQYVCSFEDSGEGE